MKTPEKKYPKDDLAKEQPSASKINPGWTNPPQGKLVVVQKNGSPMLAQFRIDNNSGPKGGFYSQTTPRGGFSNFEGKVDAWADVPEMTSVQQKTA